ncbi:hypothetical protein Tsp_09193 [Trichinella spiralis]|uniref:hypothetical protein n=1 Tax=Trichinella spiralis TaxID=6334 RepID=UPI0001EFBF38|nr:hypothetical protein Tsp_09193 [Trichinella spiralis]
MITQNVIWLKKAPIQVYLPKPVSTTATSRKTFTKPHVVNVQLARFAYAADQTVFKRTGHHVRLLFRANAPFEIGRSKVVIATKLGNQLGTLLAIDTFDGMLHVACGTLSRGFVQRANTAPSADKNCFQHRQTHWSMF